MHTEFKSILKLALPIAFIYLAGMLMNIVDTMFVGRLGPNELAAATLAHSIFSVFFVFSIGILTSLDFFISKDVGANNKKESIVWLQHGLMIAAVLGILFALLMQFSNIILSLFGLEQNLIMQAMQFLRIMSFSLIPFLLFLVIRQFLQSYSIVTPIVITLIFANLLNVFFNWVFVFGNMGSPKLGLEGSALATILSRVMMLLTSIIFLRAWQKRENLYLKNTPFKWSKFKEILSMGFPAGMQMLLEVGVFSTSTLLAGKFGNIPLASHQIVLHIASFTFMIPLGISSAATVLIGNAIGENNIKKAINRGEGSFTLGAIINIISSVLLLILSDPLMRMFTPNEEIIKSGKELIIIASFFQLFDATQVIGAGVMRGFGITRSVFVGNLIGHWFVGLPIGVLLAFNYSKQIWGIWIGLCAGLIFVAIFLLVLFIKKRQELIVHKR